MVLGLILQQFTQFQVSKVSSNFIKGQKQVLILLFLFFKLLFNKPSRNDVFSYGQNSVPAHIFPVLCGIFA